MKSTLPGEAYPAIKEYEQMVLTTRGAHALIARTLRARRNKEKASLVSSASLSLSRRDFSSASHYPEGRPVATR